MGPGPENDNPYERPGDVPLKALAVRWDNRFLLASIVCVWGLAGGSCAGVYGVILSGFFYFFGLTAGALCLLASAIAHRRVSLAVRSREFQQGCSWWVFWALQLFGLLVMLAGLLFLYLVMQNHRRATPQATPHVTIPETMPPHVRGCEMVCLVANHSWVAAPCLHS
jgi:hypothetical protein